MSADKAYQWKFLFIFIMMPLFLTDVLISCFEIEFHNYLKLRDSREKKSWRTKNIYLSINLETENFTNQITCDVFRFFHLHRRTNGIYAMIPN